MLCMSVGATSTKAPSTKAPSTKTPTPSTKTTTSQAASQTTAPKTTAPSPTANATCADCDKVNFDNTECKWNTVESESGYHIQETGHCPCPESPDDNSKDHCKVVRRRIRNIPALQAWSASLFLMSICIAGKIHRRTPNFSVIFQSLIVILDHP